MDGAAFARMIVSASAAIEQKKQKINELNVFPVPDGDTGTNMSMTLAAAAQDLKKRSPESLTKASDMTASALLRGARGNSGVILSLLFRGFSKSLKGKLEANGKDFAEALSAGVEAAYKAVMKPAEGTILTVSRLTGDAARDLAADDANLESVLMGSIETAKVALENTVNQNPVLKKAGVVDAGGMGFMTILKAMLASLRGEVTAPVSAAKPKIANYHFTTITPVLGVVTVGEKSFVMADIPGLIEGASEGIGLGHSFLRHVERCRLIVHVVDVSGIEGRDPEDDFEKINYELKNFSEEISERPQIVVMNKCDLASEEQIAKFRKYIEDKGLPCFECSAATTKGTAQVIEYIAGELDKLPPPIRFEAQPLTARELDEQELKKKEFTITKQDGIYIVDAPFMVPVLSMVNMEDYESLQYFQRVLRFSGIIDKLEEMGVQEDDTVSIYDFEFRYLR